MLQSLIKERFKLAEHTETRDASVYLLTIAKSGVKMHEGGQVRLNKSIQVDDSGKPDWADGWTMSTLASYTSRILPVGQVVDATGLTSKYGVEIEFSRGDGDDRPNIFTAVQDQLGLRMQPGKASIQMMIIDRVEKPGDN